MSRFLMGFRRFVQVRQPVLDVLLVEDRHEPQLYGLSGSGNYFQAWRSIG